MVALLEHVEVVIQMELKYYRNHVIMYVCMLREVNMLAIVCTMKPLIHTSTIKSLLVYQGCVCIRGQFHGPRVSFSQRFQ